jgi:hypothetical protein
MIALLITFTVLFILGSIAPLLITDDVQDVVALR